MAIGYDWMRRTNLKDGITPAAYEYHEVRRTKIGNGAEDTLYPPVSIIIEPHNHGNIALNYGGNQAQATRTFEAIEALKGNEHDHKTHILGGAQPEHAIEGEDHIIRVSKIMQGNGLTDHEIWRSLLPQEAITVMRRDFFGHSFEIPRPKLNVNGTALHNPHTISP